MNHNRSRRAAPALILWASAVLLLCAASPLSADTRLFVPDFHVGGGADTQLLAVNNNDRDATLDVWAFLKNGELLGQAQVRLKAHATRPFTMSELFGSRQTEASGWLAAVSETEGVGMSYNFPGERGQTFEAREWLTREALVNIGGAAGKVLRISNASSVSGAVTVRKKDNSGRFLGMHQLSVGPFQQVELPSDSIEGASDVEVLSNSEILAELGESHSKSSRVPALTREPGDDDVLSLVVSSEEPVGAYQVILRFNPRVAHFTAEDIEGGSAEGFESKPLAIGIDNDAGELRLASFQVGSGPSGNVDVARIHVHHSRGTSFQFGLKVEEITDLRGNSKMDVASAVKLVRIP